MPFAELLEMTYQALGFLYGRTLEVESILSWRGCQDGDSDAISLVRLNIFDDMLYLT
jgi:hypothetical protein